MKKVQFKQFHTITVLLIATCQSAGHDDAVHKPEEVDKEVAERSQDKPTESDALKQHGTADENNGASELDDVAAERAESNLERTASSYEETW